MIISLLNQKCGAGKTKLALHLAGQWARQGQRITLIDADLVLMPVQPSPFDGWASAEMALIRDARIYCPTLLVRFVLNRCGVRTVLARDTARRSRSSCARQHHRPAHRLAAAAQSGRLVFERDDAGPAAREIAALSAEINGLDLGRCAR